MTARKSFLTLHLVGGLLSAVTLIFLGLSGAILVFENEIDHWLNHNLYNVIPSGPRLPLNSLISNAEVRHAGYKVTGLIIPVEDSIADTLNLRSASQGKALSITLDPYSGAELGALDALNQFTRKVHQFHTNLLMGTPGKTINVASAILLGFLSLSGLYLWWPRKIWKTGGGGVGTGLNFEMHNFLGFYSSIFMLLFAITGIVIHWDNEVAAFINRRGGIAEEPSESHSSASSQNGARLSADQLFVIATETVPGARISSMQGLGSDTAIRITMKYPEDRTPLGRTNLYLGPITGEIKSMQTSRTGPMGMRIAKLWNREMHTGDIGGWPTRVLACAASLTLPIMAITGPLIWVGRVRRKQQRNTVR